MVFRKTLKKICLRKFLVRVILDTSLLYQELPLPSSCCKVRLPSEIAKSSSPKSYISKGRSGLRKSKKYFRLIYDQGDMNHGKKWFFRKTFVLENFWSESFSIRPSCIESSRFRARVAREACLPRSHYKKEPSSPKSYIEG